MILQILPPLIVFMFLLIINGEPLRVIFLRRLGLFSNLDFIENCILDVYLGGLLLYLIALIPFPIFNSFILVGITVFCIVFSLLVHRKRLRDIMSVKNIKWYAAERRSTLFAYIFVFAIFLVALYINVVSASHLVFGCVFDESAHSLKVEVILENGYVPMTLEPYLPEGIIYPQASHVIFAFACLVMNYNVPKSVFHITLLFKALPVFGAYFLGRRLSNARIYALVLGFVFAFISSWPLYVVWGSNPFLLGFPLFLVNLGLFYSLLNSAKNGLANIVAVGLLFGYCGALIVSFIQTLIVAAFIVLLYYILRRRSLAARRFYEISILFLASLLPLVPVFYRFFIFYPYPGHNIGIPSDFEGYEATRLPFSMTEALKWAFENLSPHFPLRLLTLIQIVGFAILFWKIKGHKGEKVGVAFALTVFASATLLSFVSALLPSDLEFISWGHQGLIISISLNMLLAIFYVRLASVYQSLDFKRFPDVSSKKFYKHVLAVTIIAILLISPYLYYRFTVDPQVLANTYRMFGATTADDHDLMFWMKENLTRGAVILVSPYEPSLFIPAISQHKIIFPYAASQFSHSYRTLVALLLDNVVNATAYDLMRKFNVTHVYVGYDAAYWWFERHKWDQLLFLGNPNFKLVKNFAGAYLFEINCTNPDVVFLDDFEHENWYEYGWRTYSDGCGIGNVTIANSSMCGFGNCLKVTSQAVYTALLFKHVQYVVREVYVQNNSDVSISFSLNITEGFNTNAGDTFAILISNVYRNQSIAITTPNGVFKDYFNSIFLDKLEGSFKFNLSDIWLQKFNCSVPKKVVLEFVNWDFDGVKNVVYIDNILVTCTPSTLKVNETHSN
ncbi:MAG: DUF6541 family protein [Candidatus Bathyarchaeia archaeon]